jgi:hypothetical protein
MKNFNTYLLFLTFLSVGRIYSQVSINYSQAPAVGDVYLYHKADTNGLWAIANQSGNWNFDGLNINDTLNKRYFLTPTGNTYQSEFVNSNLVSTDDSVLFNFFNISSSLFERVGSGSPTAVIKYADSYKILSFPFSQGNNVSDIFYSNPYSTGGFNNTVTSGTNNFFCNDVGTLNIGGLSYQNILLLRSNQTILYDYNNSTYTTTQQVQNFAWFDSFSKFPLLEYERVVTTNSWETTSNTSANVNVKDGLLTNTRSAKHTINNSVVLSNNRFTLNSNGVFDNATIIDMQGKIVYTEKNISEIDISNLKRGVFLVLYNIGDKAYTHKFSI